MTLYVKRGNSFNVTNNQDLDIHELLPAGNYVVKIDPMTNAYYLETIDSFEAPARIYGDTLRNTDRILNTFNDRPATTGVMLAGEKGSGKTLLAKMLSVEGARQGVPTIVINAPHHGDRFNAFIQSIDQPTIILFDEFEKVFNCEEQEAILTLLDGVFPSKKLFVLTCNDKWRVDSHMRNRPGRIYYMLDFKGLTAEFIEEYCTENLKNKSYIEKVGNVASLFAEFNFDMLKALVEEMNRYNEAPQEALLMLNTKPEFGDKQTYDVTLTDSAGVDVKREFLGNDTYRGNPLREPVNVGWDTHPDDDCAEYMHTEFTPSDIVQIDSKAGMFVFKNKSGERLVLTKQASKFEYNYFGAF